MSKPVIIAAATRTPIGAFQGVLAPVTAPQIGTAAIRGALAAARIDAPRIPRLTRAHTTASPLDEFNSPTR